MSIASKSHPVLIGGAWEVSTSNESFHASNPRTGEALADQYPVSGWDDLQRVISESAKAATEMRVIANVGEKLAEFLEAYAVGIEAQAEALVTTAALETALPASPRLRDVELPRTTNQLRLAAKAAREGSWLQPRIDSKANIRSCFAPIGPVFVIGPNNFPFAFNAISGGDFAAAIAAGNPVIAKAHPLHPSTSRLLAEISLKALQSAGLPPALVQMFYHCSSEDGLRLIAAPEVKAVAFTGSRHVGLQLKSAADRANKPFFGEMSSLNPVVLLPGALKENVDGLVEQFSTSVLMGTGQFCTKPGLCLLMSDESAESLIKQVTAKFTSAASGVLFSNSGKQGLLKSLSSLKSAGADVLTGGAENAQLAGFGVQNTLLKITAGQFLKSPHDFQTEAFGNASLVILAENVTELVAVIQSLEGQLTGSIYSAKSGADDGLYDQVASVLRPLVGRIIDDKMPTGVAVSPAMNHGGPFPATSQPHFTAVGLPISISRFTQLQCFDNVRPHRLPPCLQDKNPTGQMWRQIDGEWTQKSL